MISLPVPGHIPVGLMLTRNVTGKIKLSSKRAKTMFSCSSNEITEVVPGHQNHENSIAARDPSH